MKKICLLFVFAFCILHSAFSQDYYPQVRTRGAVEDGELAVFDGVSGRYIRSGTAMLGMSNFVPISASSNYLVYNPATKTLTGCVTNENTGPAGTNGEDGLAASVGVAWVSNGVPGSAVVVTNVGTSSNALLGFIIPAGWNGTNGIDGAAGSNGTAGEAASVGVAWVSNGVPGSAVVVTNVGTSSNALLGFIIPAGWNGTNGMDGAAGSNGLAGEAASVGVAWVSNGVPGSAVVVTNVGTSSNALFGFIIPAGWNGTNGMDGAAGSNGTSGEAASVGVAWVSNGVPGSAVVVTNVGTSSNALFGFIIPAGWNGTNGMDGAAGSNGVAGEAASVGVAWVSNGVPGSAVVVTNVGTSSNALFGFIIPAGWNGTNGMDGAAGSNGTAGEAATITVAYTSNGAPGSAASVINVGSSNAAAFGFVIPTGSNGVGDISSTQVVTRIVGFSGVDFDSLVGTNNPEDLYQFSLTIATNPAFTGTTVSIQSTNMPTTWNYWNGVTIETMQTGYLPHSYLNSYSANIAYVWTNSIRGNTYYCRGYIIVSNPPCVANIINKILEAK